MRYGIIVILLILCVLTTGCVTGQNVEQPQTGVVTQTWISGYISNTDQGEIIKVHIPEDNVTCYIFDNYYGGGISCLRDGNAL